jgi:hypothetical protein
MDAIKADLETIVRFAKQQLMLQPISYENLIEFVLDSYPKARRGMFF